MLLHSGYTVSGASTSTAGSRLPSGAKRWRKSKPGTPAAMVSQKNQIPPDLVVKSQATDIIDILLQLIRRLNGVHRACRNRKSRSELLSTSEAQWSTTKSDGVCPSPSRSTCPLQSATLSPASCSPLPKSSCSTRENAKPQGSSPPRPKASIPDARRAPPRPSPAEPRS